MYLSCPVLSAKKKTFLLKKEKTFDISFDVFTLSVPIVVVVVFPVVVGYFVGNGHLGFARRRLRWAIIASSLSLTHFGIYFCIKVSSLEEITQVRGSDHYLSLKSILKGKFAIGNGTLKGIICNR